MRLRHHVDGCVSESLLRRERSPVDDRTVEIALFKCISEAVAQARQRFFGTVERHGTVENLRQRPKLADAVNMVAMVMGDYHRIDATDMRRQQLLAKVWTAIDEDVIAPTLHQDRGPQAVVARLGRIALPPFIADLRDPGRRPAAEDPYLHAALLNNLKKFAV